MALNKFFQRKRPQATQTDDIPDLWSKCQHCGTQIYNREFDQNLRVCPKCGFHHRIPVMKRLEFLLDQDSFQQKSGHVYPKDPLHFVDTESYQERLNRTQKKTGRPDAIVWGQGAIEETPLTVVVMDFEFSGGSMGSVVGEEIARAADHAAEHHLPLLIIAASGGARMQESALSLMQLAKTTVALQRLSEKGLPYFSLLTDPTTGGVTASFATIADVILAEPGALIGFAGPRVIQQTIRQNLPEGFQRAEFLEKHGMIDSVVDRRKQREVLKTLFSHFGGAS
ncbi:acetyl-CoA carboxylase, carboxyltransferase subunit beta [Deinococcus cellulosilyticus]|uniref:Acetyl-coenzyme A carboxylase carboxyl transferase subunit beta n=1 Tax=Deinococcus cellulosilyticus (strain DSM 18568 / NBRC 106333 / KACC 11606 / 5516J-15) TaxID=1223518 RepID=A0A511NBW9_DEIC1|nr:acetyl-CoA carboxylase, carboxyltransferase subunit beta [Deinococcus cellulosilyticus]GEM49998.1 acetyl-coenzyme A carboxylase carboxyl transferase subunit beta [Deinococcus cellulosilyticus NBRC 106333 = KACC 11606]